MKRVIFFLVESLQEHPQFSIIDFYVRADKLILPTYTFYIIVTSFRIALESFQYMQTLLFILLTGDLLFSELRSHSLQYDQI